MLYRGLVLGKIAFPSFPFIIFGVKSLFKYFDVCLQFANKVCEGVPIDFMIKLSCSC
jgi:hypothetical protein